MGLRGILIFLTREIGWKISRYRHLTIFWYNTVSVTRKSNANQIAMMATWGHTHIQANLLVWDSFDIHYVTIICDVIKQNQSEVGNIDFEI